jgi:hypothetical protein
MQMSTDVKSNVPDQRLNYLVSEAEERDGFHGYTSVVDLVNESFQWCKIRPDWQPRNCATWDHEMRSIKGCIKALEA